MVAFLCCVLLDVENSHPLISAPHPTYLFYLLPGPGIPHKDDISQSSLQSDMFKIRPIDCGQKGLPPLFSPPMAETGMRGEPLSSGMSRYPECSNIRSRYLTIWWGRTTLAHIGSHMRQTICVILFKSLIFKKICIYLLSQEEEHRLPISIKVVLKELNKNKKVRYAQIHAHHVSLWRYEL